MNENIVHLISQLNSNPLKYPLISNIDLLQNFSVLCRFSCYPELLHKSLGYRVNKVSISKAK